MAPRHPFRPGIIGLILFIALLVFVDAVVVPLLLHGRAANQDFYVLNLIFGLAALVMLVVLVLYDRVYARNIRRILAGEYWAHWRYLAGEWDRFMAQEQQRNRRIAGRGLLVFLGSVALLAALYLLLGAATDPVSLAYLILLGAALAFVLVLNRRRDYAGERAYELRHGGPAESYIGSLGVYQPNGYFALRGFDLQLVRVMLQPGNPSLLTFVRQSRMPGLPPTNVTHTFRVPVPEGRDDEAHALAQRFQAGAAVR